MFKFIVAGIAMLSLVSCGLPFKPADASLMRDYGGDGGPCATGGNR
jgi:hypothetical protein